MERKTQIFLCYPFGSQHQITCVTLESAKLENMKLVSTETDIPNIGPMENITERETFGPQLYVNHKCSISSLCHMTHINSVFNFLPYTHCSIGPSTCAMTSVMWTRRSSMIGGKGGRYACCFAKPRREKSQGVSPGERRGQGKHSKYSQPAHPMHLLENCVFSSFLTPKW